MLDRYEYISSKFSIDVKEIFSNKVRKNSLYEIVLKLRITFFKVEIAGIGDTAELRSIMNGSCI